MDEWSDLRPFIQLRLMDDSNRLFSFTQIIDAIDAVRNGEWWKDGLYTFSHTDAGVIPSDDLGTLIEDIHSALTEADHG